MKSTLDQTLLSARETAGRLGVKLDTLYAYVSRGLLHSVEVPGTRERRYDSEEVEQFRSGRGISRYGEPRATVIPVIDSTICTIEGGRFFYRGEDAINLAKTATLEQIAALLWEQPEIVVPPSLRQRVARHLDRGQGEQFGLIERCQTCLAEASAADFAALDLSRNGITRTGSLILSLLAGSVAETSGAELPLHQRLAAAWGRDGAETDLLRRCLVLLADHELNTSAFVARCIASTRATPYAVVTGALAALSGRRHGGSSTRAEAMFRALTEAADPLPAIAARLARDETLPGMGQPLYPDGDPRAVAILAATHNAVPERAAWIGAVSDAAIRLTGQLPNVDFALGIMATVLRLPPGASLAIFVVARAVGWIAHAIEQYDSEALIRPRARYTGRRPVSAE